MSSLHIVLSVVILSFISLLSNAQVDLQAVTIAGSVDRSSQDVVRELALAYKLVDPKMTIKLLQSTSDAVGGLVSGSLDFGLAIQGWSESVAASAPNVVMLPLLLTGFVPIYRLDTLGANAPPLIFSRDAIVGIVAGTITNWEHPELKRTNPLVSLPNQTINVVLDSTNGSRHSIQKRAFRQFNATAFAESGMQVNNDVDYPIHKYARHEFTSGGLTSLVAAITANDGGFALSYHSVADSVDVQIGSMINKAGKVVRLNEDSLTFAALENDQVRPDTPSTAHVLTDPSGEHVWPLAIYTYVIIDTQYSTHTCRVRESTVKFFLWIYENSVAHNILTSLNIAAVPDLIRTKANVIDIVRNQVLCRGMVALSKQKVTEQPFSVSGQFYAIARLLSSVYNDGQQMVKSVPQVTPDDLMIAQLATSETDLVLVNPDYVDPAVWATVVNSNDYLILPLVAAAASVFFNPTLTKDIVIDPAVHEMVLDVETQVAIYTNCVRNFNDPRMIATNPWLEDLLGNTTVPIVKSIACDKDELTPLADYFDKYHSTVMRTPGLMSDDIRRCIAALPGSDFYTAITTCTKGKEHDAIFTNSEKAAPLLAMGNNGGVSFQLRDGDDTKIYPKMLVTRNGKQSLTTPDFKGVLGCAYDTFDPNTISFDFAKSTNATCWPTSQKLVAIVRNQYWSTSTNASSCSRGYDALRFLNWYFNADEIATITDALNIADLCLVPGVKQRSLEALNAVRCDDDTLLVKMPYVWELGSALFGFGISAAVIGMTYTLCLIGCVLVYQRDPIIRVSSPLFMLISLVGTLLMFGSVIALVSPVTNASCNALVWLIATGSMVMFLPIFAKIYRVYRIFQRRRLSVVKISNRKLLFGVAVVLLVEVIFMGAWQAVSPLRPYLSIDRGASGSRDSYYTQCKTDGDGDVFLATAGVLTGLLLLCGLIMAFSIRGVAQTFNESKQVALAIYNTLFTVGVIAAIMIVIEAQGEILVTLIMMAALWVSFFTSSILVCPKLMQIYGHKAGTAENASLVGSSGGSSGFSFMSLDVLDSLPMIGSYILALRRHLEQVETKQGDLKRAKGGIDRIGLTQGTTAATPASVSRTAHVTASPSQQRGSGSMRSLQNHSSGGSFTPTRASSRACGPSS